MRDGTRTRGEPERERENWRQLLLLGESEMYKLLRGERKEEKTRAAGVGFL